MATSEYVNGQASVWKQKDRLKHCNILKLDLASHFDDPQLSRVNPSLTPFLPSGYLDLVAHI
jgi:hypothetical protein